MKKIALDGWALVNASASPQALHLLGLLAHLPADRQAVALLPVGSPGEVSAGIPAWFDGSVKTLGKDCPNTAWGRLAWEQRHLPALARQAKADYLHADSLSAPFFPGLVCTTSSSAAPAARRGPAEHLCAALGAGGAARAHSRPHSMLWPADLASPPGLAGLVLCKPFVHPAFHPASPAGGPLDSDRAYVLYHGPGRPADLHRLAAAWSWAARSVGSHISLAAAGLAEPERRLLQQIAAEYQVSDSLQALPDLTPEELPALYQNCAALFHPAEVSPWGDPILLALACGKAVAAAYTPGAQQRVGPAAYLADINSPRALGAALLTILIEERIAAELGSAAQERFASLPGADVQSALGQLWK